MLQPWQTGKLIRILDETPQTRRFWIEVQDSTVFTFSPGQFVTIDLPIHERPNKRLRSYSIASGPAQHNVFELVIVRLQDGAGTRYLFEECVPGTELRFRGPQGVFTLQEPLDRDTFFICTGTGVAPFRSMLQYIALHKISHKRIDLIFGSRTQEDLLYRDEFRALEQELEGFRYHPVLSREDWAGEKGYVHGVYQRLLQERSAGAEGLYPARFYLCGWRNMIDEAKTTLQAAGYTKHDIIQEIYG